MDENAKKIVLPGDLICEAGEKKAGSHAFARNGKIYSDVVGVFNDEGQWVNIVPLEGKYDARQGDIIIGVVVAERFAGYDINVNAVQPSFVPKIVLRTDLKVGDIVSGMVESVSEVKEVSISSVRPFLGGELISVSPVKVPRMIGKNASMMEILKLGSASQLVIGKNGFIWAKGGNIELLARALKKIELEAHLNNLTNRIKEFIEGEKKQVKS
ncbi:hypothetical protein HZB89_00270 [archaeon]|nr:hypothetical protein [archaeon]